MLRFLYLFAAFREAVIARAVAESDARACRSRADRLEDRVAELSRELVEAHKVAGDRLAQRFISTRLWSETEAKEAKEAPEHSTLTFSKQQGRAAVLDMRDKFREQLRAYASTPK